VCCSHTLVPPIQLAMVPEAVKLSHRLLLLLATTGVQYSDDLAQLGVAVWQQQLHRMSCSCQHIIATRQCQHPGRVWGHQLQLRGCSGWGENYDMQRAFDCGGLQQLPAIRVYALSFVLLVWFSCLLPLACDSVPARVLLLVCWMPVWLVFAGLTG
jgi:hypothetical protein